MSRCKYCGSTKVVNCWVGDDGSYEYCCEKCFHKHFSPAPKTLAERVIKAVTRAVLGNNGTKNQ